MCAVGWCIESKHDVTTKERFIDMLFVAVLEILVASATLIYCLFLMPMFFMLHSAWLQMAWLCVLHPLYFEITTGFIVRKVCTAPPRHSCLPPLSYTSSTLPPHPQTSPLPSPPCHLPGAHPQSLPGPH